MKRFLLFTVLIGAMPLYMMAQDDLYFTPKKSEKKVSSSYENIDDAPAYYCGSDRDVDEYNRRGFGSYFQKIGADSLGNDIIEFHSGDMGVSDTLHVYPGATVNYDVEDDYAYTRRMSRFDDYYWYDPWYYGYGYGPYWRARWGWYDPWYYGWYDPWYYSWYGWGYPYYYHHWNWGWGRPAYAYYGGITGTRNHGTVNRRQGNAGTSNFSGYRGSNSRNNTTNNTNFSNRRNTNTYNNTNTVSRPSYNNNSGSFGGSRGGGGSFGGGSRGGGGHFGGRR